MTIIQAVTRQITNVKEWNNLFHTLATGQVKPQRKNLVVCIAYSIGHYTWTNVSFHSVCNPCRFTSLYNCGHLDSILLPQQFEALIFPRIRGMTCSGIIFGMFSAEKACSWGPIAKARLSRFCRHQNLLNRASNAWDIWIWKCTMLMIWRSLHFIRFMLQRRNIKLMLRSFGLGTQCFYSKEHNSRNIGLCREFEVSTESGQNLPLFSAGNIIGKTQLLMEMA